MGVFQRKSTEEGNHSGNDLTAILVLVRQGSEGGRRKHRDNNLPENGRGREKNDFQI